MIRLFLKLVIAAFIANAAWRIGTEYITHYKFRDAVREAAMYRNRNDDDLRQRVLALASEFDLPLTDDQVTIRDEERHTVVEGWYVKPIELLPGYLYPWRFVWAIDAYAMPPKQNGLKESVSPAPHP